MRFREFLLNEIFGNENDIKKRLIKGYGIQFHINDKGEIIPGLPSFGMPQYDIEPKYRSVSIQNGDPHSSEFKKVINYFKKFIPDIENWKTSVVNLSHHKVPLTGYSYPYRHRERSVSRFTKSTYQDIPKYLYHGTSTELWHEGINKSGLVPRLQTTAGRFGSYGRSMALSLGDRVYLSNDPDAAARGAAEQAAEQHGGYPLILKIDTYGLFPEKFVHDEDIDLSYKNYEKNKEKPMSPLKFSLKTMGTLGYSGKIPPSLIKPFSIAKWQEDKKGDKYLKWLPWEDVGRTEHAVTKQLKKGDTYDLYRSPNFYALLDAGIVEKEYRGDIKILEIDDEKIRKAIKDSVDWAQDAKKIADDFNDWGQKGVKGFSTSLDNISDEAEPYIKMLTDSGLYDISGGWLQLKNYYNPENYIKLAKLMRKHDMHYEDLLSALKELVQ